MNQSVDAQAKLNGPRVTVLVDCPKIHEGLPLGIDGGQDPKDAEQWTPGLGKPNVFGSEVDLPPVLDNEVLANPRAVPCALPGAMTVRFPPMNDLSDHPCLLTGIPVTATLMSKIITLHKVVAADPVLTYKDCASAALMNFRHCSGLWKGAVLFRYRDSG